MSRRKSFDSETLVAIGQRIREARGSRTQDEFASMLEVSRAALTNYEAGRRLPNDLILKRISDISGIPVPTILFGPTLVPFDEYLHSIENDAIRESQRRPGFIPRFMISDDELAMVSLFRLLMDMGEPAAWATIKTIIDYWEAELTHAKSIDGEPPIQWGEGHLDRLKAAYAEQSWEKGVDPMQWLWPTLAEEANARAKDETSEK
ncbi:MAG: helix-turn-helix domain-containing protein [Rhizobiaceae bacterium]|nr:helix-turn-helix domain-containing protein [Rhizobiaceae bacterium]